MQLTSVNKTTSNWVICSSRKKHFQYSIEFHQINMLSWNFLAQLMHFRKSSAPTMAIFFTSKNVRIFFFSFAGQEEWWFAAAADNCLVKLGSWGRKTEERKKKKLSSQEPAIFSKVIVYIWAIFMKNYLKFGGGFSI